MIYFYFCVEYGPVLRPVYSLPLLLNPHRYRMYNATSQEKDVAYRCKLLGVSPFHPVTVRLSHLIGHADGIG